jgi:hypothetical protein
MSLNRGASCPACSVGCLADVQKSWQECSRPKETIDSLAGKIPRGSITEIFGTASTGRTTALLSIVGAATAREEYCAFVDTHDALDPASAAAGGIDLQRLLWVRCGGNPEHALKAADLLVNAGGFGVVALDLADVAPQIVRRIPLTSWFRLRRAVENTPTVLVILEQEPYVKTCASLILEMKRDGVAWSGNLLQNASFQPIPRKPAGQAGCSRFEVGAVG